MTKVRTRFAPSPTGALHAGAVRTALFAWLLARQSNGHFLLRIEDTDQKREVEGSADNIQDTLKWLGLNWDEGPGVEGSYGPYYQSQRLDIYKEWATKLYNEGKAYADPYTSEEVQAFREQAQSEKRPFLYRDHRPKSMPEWDGSQPLRLKSTPKTHTWHDAVMGELTMGPEMVDDFILMKSDGFPTYNFCHIVDDFLMGATHVIRSQEFLSSTPKFLDLYDALGIKPPVLVTLPPVLREDGRKKLGKRDGAKEMLWYREQGYLPEALINFMATLGWNDGTEQEVFSVEELMSKFSLDRIQKSGAKFDEQRLLWMNGVHIRGTEVSSLMDQVSGFWPKEADAFDDKYKTRVLGLVQERLKYFAELPELTRFFFVDLPVDPSLISNNKQLKKFDAAELKSLLEQARASLEESDFSQNDLTERLNSLLEKTGQKPGVLFSLIRIATTQAPASPGLAETLAVLGKDRSLTRLNTHLHSLND